jgi:hypothetical protein
MKRYRGLISTMTVVRESHHTVAPSVLLRFAVDIVAEHVGDYSASSLAVTDTIGVVNEASDLTDIQVLTA